ncbi:MAG: VWA domain-containing protein [Spirochaetia bacterium]
MGKELKAAFILSLFTVLFFLSGESSPLRALEREGNISIHIILDRSLSMEGDIGQAKRFIEDDIIRQLLIPGDSITLIEFYKSPATVFSKTISSEQDQMSIISELDLIEADGPYTDIGRALDFYVENTLASEENPRTHTILLSDLKQEAPAGSPYAGTVENYSHPHLTPKKEMRQNGWRILIIGPEIEEQAERIAREVVSVRPEAE